MDPKKMFYLGMALVILAVVGLTLLILLGPIR